MKTLKLFKLILNLSSHHNHFTYSTVLDACAGYSAVLVGNQVHVHLDVVLLTSLVDMYAKCAETKVASCIFESIPSRNSIIGDYANMGLQRRQCKSLRGC